MVPERLRAPSQDGAVLAEPSLDAVGELLTENRRRLAHALEGFPGSSFEEWRRRGRLEAVAVAQQYLRRAGEPVPAVASASLLMAGHQPELFHPGVWVKNFALHRLAHQHGATAVNLVVDNDTVKSTLLRVPTTEDQHPDLFRMTSVPLDRWEGEVPYEERGVRDEAMFASLPERLAPLVKHWSFDPMLPAFWEDVRRQAQRTPLLGERLAAARRGWERRWGSHNLELPVSLLCQSESFAGFACHLLANLPRFHAIYNDAVHGYRAKYGLRSQNHPVPDLAVEGDWLEVPLWAWRAGDTRRGRLFAHHTANAIELRAGNEPWPTIPTTSALSTQHSALSTQHSPLSTQHSPLTTSMIAAWQNLEPGGFKVRSRALTNTLYARVFLSDLFVHGIGGGKYDELTDEIIRRYYGFEPPRFLVLSATLLLPLPRLPARVDTCKRVAHELRDLHWNPQRHLADHDARAEELAQQKRAWIARDAKDCPERRERFRALRELNEQLHPYVAAREQTAAEELVRCDQQLAANEVLERRDYAFCLYPEARLRAFCARFLGVF